MKFIPGETQDYVIARLSSEPRRMLFTVTKFDGSAEPVTTYNVVVTPKTVRCDCPASRDPTRKKPCRHQTMVALWVLNGDKDPDNMTAKEVKL